MIAINLTMLDTLFKRGNFYMSSIQRRQLHKSWLKGAILKAALQIVEKEGYQSLTIRKIAGAIGYSLPTVYEFFQNKDELIKELQKEWIRKFLGLIQKIHALEKEPMEALRKIAVAYAEYAFEHGLHYRSVMETEHLAGDFVEINTLRTILKEWIQAASKDTSGLDDKVDLFRGHLHGIVSLALTKRLSGNKERWLVLVEKGVAGLMSAWK